MTKEERELLTLGFSNEGLDRGAKEETMEPWDLTIMNWEEQGLETDFNQLMKLPAVPTEIGFIRKDCPVEPADHYYMTMLADPVFDLEKTIGYDPLVRMAFRIPFLSYEEEILKEHENGWKNNCVLTKLVYVYEGIEKESPKSKRNKLSIVEKRSQCY